jgi:hypothetical protein
MNVLDVTRMLDINRYGRVFVDATEPELLYRDRSLLAAEHNLGFLRRCVEGFRYVNFAAQASGRIYLRIESGTAVLIDPAPLQAALRDPDTLAGVTTVVPTALGDDIATAERAQYLRRHGADADRSDTAPTLGVWGDAAGIE